MASSPEKSKPPSITASVQGSISSIEKKNPTEQLDECQTPDFIYGGPFIMVEKPSPFLNTATPFNIQLQGTFKKSFAYHSLKERFPVILTKIIDNVSRNGSTIKSAHGASDAELRSFISHVTKLKNDLVTNKEYELLSVDTPEAKRWNDWIAASENKTYFNNVWVFSECYVYRKIYEGVELSKSLEKFDYFGEQKNQAFQENLEAMCVVAEKLLTMLPPSEKDKRKADFVTLLKLSLWSNKCDLLLTLGDSALKVPDPFQMIIDLKDKILVDDSGKIADQVFAKAEALAKVIEGNTTFKYQCSCHRLATLAGMPIEKEKSEPPPQPTPEDSKSPGKEETKEVEAPEEKKIPCPAKLTVASAVMFDIVVDNAGYELFSDLCVAHFLLSQKVVKKVRFHVKKIPWFVSDVTQQDFEYVINSCAGANFSKTVESDAPPASGGEGAEPPPPRNINSSALNEIGKAWSNYLKDGTFIVTSDAFWTSPHVYKDMKKIEYNLYRSLQYAVAVMFKGDLNYRKLIGEKNWNPSIGFEASLQGFIPAPIIALRTVKAELISGLPKGKFEQISKIDEKWMEKGDYGVIQFCAKAEPLKVSEKPCVDYGKMCFGKVCPTHDDL